VGIRLSRRRAATSHPVDTAHSANPDINSLGAAIAQPPPAPHNASQATTNCEYKKSVFVWPWLAARARAPGTEGRGSRKEKGPSARRAPVVPQAAIELRLHFVWPCRGPGSAVHAVSRVARVLGLSCWGC